MKFSDIIALAKAGYKPGEIKELLELAEPAEPQEKPDDPAPDQEPAPPPQDESTQEPASDPGPDYKTLYEETQKKLKEAQAANRRQPVNPPKEKTLEDIMREVFS